MLMQASRTHQKFKTQQGADELEDSANHVSEISLADLQIILRRAALLALRSRNTDYEAAPEAAPAAFGWTGGYVGLQAGYAWGDSELDFTSFPTTSNPKPDGVLGGVYVGYNAQLRNKIVLGVEGDFVFASLDDNDRIYVFGSQFGGQSLDVDVNWTAAVRAS